MSKRNKIISIHQLALPFGQRGVRTILYEDRQHFFWFMVTLSLLSLGVYFYAINAAAHHIAVRENLESQVAEIGARLSSLEFAAIDLKNSVTLDVAHEHGFSEVKQPLYVTRGNSGSLTLNTARQ